jgi:serine/threonine protein kinase
MTYERTGKLLESCCGDSLKCKTIHAEYLAVFVILLQIGQPAFILHFIQHKRFRDRFLPFDNFESWPAVCRQLFSDFYEKQWEFCAEEFTLHLDDTVFDPRSIIPIVFQEELKGGPDSWTFKIRIHPDYNCLLSSVSLAEYAAGSFHADHCWAQEAGIEQSQYFILKVCKTDKKHLHHQEVRAYTELSRHKDIANHIAHFYGSWRHNDTYNLLLEYVEGNTLENVFKEENPTSGDDRLKFLTNLLRIMDPVLRIHCHGDTTDHNEVAQG